MRGDPQSAGVLTYGNDRFIPRPLDGQPEGKRTLALCTDDRASGAVQTRQALDYAVIG